MTALRPAQPRDGERIIQIWCRAVDATHHFLQPADRAAIEQEVRGFLPGAPLLLAVDAEDIAQAFMLVADGHLEALFVDPACRGTGIGRQLVAHALAGNRGLTVDVNAQNPQAVGFYHRLGFHEMGRSLLDAQGRAYPLIHLRHSTAHC
jgi:putative acetyltransferase